jgi:hypothetical protein
MNARPLFYLFFIVRMIRLGLMVQNQTKVNFFSQNLKKMDMVRQDEHGIHMVTTQEGLHCSI